MKHLSDTQRKWLRHLADHGETAWRAMPLNARGRAIAKNTWGGLEDAGLIEIRCGDNDLFFGITEAGRAALRVKSVVPISAEEHIAVTWNDAGEIVAVTRQDAEGRILSVIAETGKPPAAGVPGTLNDQQEQPR